MAYDKLLTGTFPADAGRVRATYPVAKYPSPAKAWATVLTDASFSCTTLSAATTTSRRVPTFVYEFDDPTGPLPPGAVAAPGFTAGAAHGFELPYLWDFQGVTLGPAQRAVADRMIDYWTRFAHTGNPNGGPGARVAELHRGQPGRDVPCARPLPGHRRDEQGPPLRSVVHRPAVTVSGFRRPRRRGARRSR